MSILIDRKTRLLVQGISGSEGLLHTMQMVAYTTNVVAGVTPGKGGEWVVEGKIPVFDSVKLAHEATGADASVVFVPARFAPDAMLEAADAGIPLVICITEGIPAQDMMQVKSFLDYKGVQLLGPNCPGVLSPGEAKAGIIPNDIAFKGTVGVVSRSGTLTYEVLYALKCTGLGVSSCVGIGGDAIHGLGFTEVLSMFEADAHTEVIILIGEIGGIEEEEAANFIAREVTKPVVSYIAGLTAPAGKRMGHAGAIIEGRVGTPKEKVQAFLSLGLPVANHPEEIAEILAAIHAVK
ncbi:MAG: succinate--CoA ligase subunit alpha [Anaerolineaceae bacterium]|nr:succinate--CoA ligase subunit alpha [Anaerolineaceae bacterium]